MTNTGQNRTLMIIHVPKAAGTTLRVIMATQYPNPKSQIFAIQNDIPAERRRLAEKPDGDKRKLRCVFGHMCWGWHKALAPGQEYQYLTILRDPVERVLSTYAYCNIHGHYLNEAVDGMPLYTFATSGVTRTCDNGMVRQLCGEDRFLREPYHDMALDFEAVTEDHLEAARANLDTCAVVGVAEQFDDMLDQCRSVLSWRIPAYEDRNVTTWDRPEWGKLDQRTREAIERHTRLDRALYDYAIARIEQRKGQS